MKFILSVLSISCLIMVACAMTLTPEQKEKLKKYHVACVADTHIDEKEIANAKKGKFSDSELLKKYIYCNLRKANLVNKQGSLNEDVLKAKLPKDANQLAVTVIVGLCKSQEGENAEDKAYKIYRCFYEATPTHVSLI